MNTFIRNIALTAALVLPASAVADPIIEILNDGSSPTTLGGYTMTEFDTRELALTCAGTGADQYVNDENVGPLQGVTSVASPIDGAVEFRHKGGTDPLCMSVDDPANADWWQYDDHDTVFTTTVNWVELIMPENTRAFSLFVGGVSGSGWIEATDSSGATTRQYFGSGSDPYVAFGTGDTPGFGVYSSDSCAAITKIVIEPWEWGTGHFAINQDPCVHGVPEPAPVWLLLTGILGITLARRFHRAGVAT